MPKLPGYYFAIQTSLIESAFTTSVLDMLRYEQATVALISDTVVVFRTPTSKPTVDRWKSFGLPVIVYQPVDVEKDPHPLARTAQRYIEYAKSES